MARRSQRYGVMLREVPKFIKNISDIGINYDLIAQTRSTTFDEDEDMFTNGILNTNNLYNQAMLEKENPYYAQSYEKKENIFVDFLHIQKLSIF